MLELCPDFGREPEIYAGLVDLLQTKIWADRRRASEALVRINDPLGILHLTYNSLIFHPELKISQEGISGRSGRFLLKQAEKLTDECIACLVSELNLPTGLLHVDILAAAESDKVIPLLLPLLSKQDNAAKAAAYILAMKGRDDGRKILEDIVDSGKLINFALIALSHIPNDRVISFLREFSDSTHPIYVNNTRSTYEEKFHGLVMEMGLLREAQCRLSLLESTDPNPVRRVMEQFYFHSIHELIENDSTRKSIEQTILNPSKEQNPTSLLLMTKHARCWISPPSEFQNKFFVYNSHLISGDLGTATSAPDFLWEFAEEEDKRYCASIQLESIKALLDVIDWSRIGNGNDMGISPRFLDDGLPYSGDEFGLRADWYFPGVKVVYSREDYEKSSVEWINHPEKYRFSSFGRLWI
jgi:hypothetical protein